MQVANPTVEPPTLQALQIAHEANYKSNFAVSWNPQVFAWTSTFVSQDDDRDSVEYLFNTQEEGKTLLLELLDNPQLPEDPEGNAIAAADLYNINAEGEKL